MVRDGGGQRNSSAGRFRHQAPRLRAAGRLIARPIGVYGRSNEKTRRWRGFYASKNRFQLLDFAFRYLTSIPGSRLAPLFEVKLLNEIGWLPYLEGCMNDDQKNLEEGFFSARQGGLLCSRCAPQYADSRRISREALAAMRYFARHSREESVKYWMTTKTESEIQEIMDRFLMDRLGYVPKSRQFMDKIRVSLKA